jgi:hypothetical protein
MTAYEYLHEAEDVWLVSGTLRWCAELWPILKDLRFSLDNDVFALDRPGKIPPWQSRSIVSVHILRGDKEVYDEHGQWDRLKLSYLMATLPPETLPIFVETASALADRLRLSLHYRSEVVIKEQLPTKLEECVAELRQHVGEPGSKEVAAAIEMTYPR